MLLFCLQLERLVYRQVMPQHSTILIFFSFHACLFDNILANQSEKFFFQSLISIPIFNIVEPKEQSLLPVLWKCFPEANYVNPYRTFTIMCRS